MADTGDLSDRLEQSHAYKDIRAKMNRINIICLRNSPGFSEQGALWFSQKWSIPIEAYRKSIQDCIEQKTAIPQWYIILNEKQEIIAGAGIIENDFHDRKDLTPNLCALFVEKAYRKQGIAKAILDFARKDLGLIGMKNLYLVTDHTEFYEKCGWSFLTFVHDNEGNPERMYTASTLADDCEARIEY